MISGLSRRVSLAVLLAALVCCPFSGESFATGTAKSLTLSQALTQAKLFAGLTAQEREVLQAAASLRRGSEGERIIEQGKPLDRMFIVLEGQAEVRINGKPIATLPAQSLVGEIEFFDRLPASAEVIIFKDTYLIELNNAALTALMQKHPRLGFVLMREIAAIECQRLRAMDQK